MKTQSKDQQRIKPQPPLSKPTFNWLKIAVLLAAAVFLTYYGKGTNHPQKPVRKHGLLGWVLPTKHHASVLWIAPDDGIDTNYTQTGARIWIHPPAEPVRLHDNYLLYGGPLLISIGDSLTSTTIGQLASMVDTGGTLVLIGKPLWPISMLRNSYPHLTISQHNPVPAGSAVPSAGISLPVGADCNAQAVYLGQQSPMVTLECGGHRLAYVDSINQIAHLDSSLVWSILTTGLECASGLQPNPQKPNVQPQAKVHVCYTNNPEFPTDSLTVHGPNLAVGLYEKENGELFVQKLPLSKWNSLSQ
jgi:hypothetical protein